MIRNILAARVLGLALAWAALGAQAGELSPSLRRPQASQVRVLTSFLPAYCLTMGVVGDLGQVENLTTIGPHEFQLTPRGLRKLRAAQVLVINGLGLEPWVGRVLESLERSARPVVVELAAGLDGQLLGRRMGGGGTVPVANAEKGTRLEAPADPHVWLDPVLAAHGVTNILSALETADPENADTYRRNAAAFVARLHRLDAELRTSLAAVRGRAFLTFHDAFGYFARRYGLNLVGVIESSPDVGPSPRRLGELRRTIRDQHARVIFTEPQYSGALAVQLARDAGVAVAELDTLESGPAAADAYERGMWRNARALREHLE